MTLPQAEQTTSRDTREQPAFNPLDPVSFLDADTALAELRSRCPVSEPLRDHFFVATDNEARAVLLDVAGFSNAGNFQLDHGDADPDPPTIAQLDPPRHNTFRRLISTGLNPRAIEAAEPFIRGTARRLIDAVSSRGRADLMSVLAQPLPALVIAHLIGVPAQRADRFTRWTAEITATVPRSFHHLPAWHEFKAFIDELVRQRRAADRPSDDIVTRLIRAEADGEQLDDSEIRMAIFQFIVAGNDTATRLIGNLVYELLADRDLWERVSDDRSLVPVAIEESLRHDSPIQWVMRRCVAARRLAGVAIRPGQRVLVGIGSANRDATAWPEPDTFRLDRDQHADRHLAMGAGRHFCLGAPLGRLEAAIALEALLDRLPGLRLAPGYERRLVASAMMRGPQRLDVTWEVDGRR